MLKDWIELCKLFTAHAVEYLLVGGQAIIAHGYPRLTKDMDLWVRPTGHNRTRVLAASTEFGAAPAAFEDAGGIKSPGMSFNAVHYIEMLVPG